jgi:hypothetical protein
MKATHPFRKMNLEEKEYKDIFTIRLNREERETLDKCKKILEQPKDSTAFKQLASIGSNVLHDNLIGNTMAIIFLNKKKNKRTGILEFEQM